HFKNSKPACYSDYVYKARRGLMAKRKKNQNKSVWLALLGLAGLVAFVMVVGVLTRGRDIALLNPKGFVAQEQHRLFMLSTAILVGFAVLVLFFIYFFAWRYRETNQKAEYNVNAGRSKALIF